MPSSNTVIKAKDVKLLKKASEPDSSVPKNRGRREGDGRSESVMTSREKSQQKWLKVVDEAKKEAYEKGVAEGRMFREREIASALTAMSTAISEIGTVKKKFYQDNEKEMLGLVLAIARKVIHTEVNVGHDVVVSVLREAVTKLADENGLKVRLNPEDLSFIVDIKQKLLQDNVISKDTVFEADAGIMRGGVVLETEHLEVDARLDHQFEKVKESLKM